MKNLARNLRTTAAATILALTIAGCGGGGGGSDSTAQTPPPAGGSTNSPPTIGGSPGASVLAGQAYSFQPTAADPNNDSLTFTVANKPAWADFNASNGRLSGTPTAAQVGAYGNISIQVSDGSANASLGPFTITVTDTAGGAATLSWTPPTQNTDGSALTLSGYQIVYGRSADNLSQSTQVSNPSVSTYVVDNLTTGTWYFAVIAVSTTGTTSEQSSVVSKTI
jgi:hypothetical protein